jgi:hypothetical protein
MLKVKRALVFLFCLQALVSNMVPMACLAQGGDSTQLPFSTQQYYNMGYGNRPGGGHVSVPSVYGRGTSRASWYLPGNAAPGDGAPPGYAPAQNPSMPMPAPAVPQSGPPTIAAGTVLPCVMMTTITEKGVKNGDSVRAQVSRNISLNSPAAYIPAGTMISGVVRDYHDGHWINKENYLSIVFEQMQFPDGRIFPIRAHLVNNFSGYGPAGDPNSDVAKHARWEQEGLHQDAGNLIDMAMTLPFSPGSIRGFWSGGTTINGGIMALGNVLLHKDRNSNLVIPSGANVHLQLEGNVDLSGSPQQANVPPANSGF